MGLETDEEPNLRAVQVLVGKVKEQIKIGLIAKGQTEVRGQSNIVGLSLSAAKSLLSMADTHISVLQFLPPSAPPFSA